MRRDPLLLEGLRDLEEILAARRAIALRAAETGLSVQELLGRQGAKKAARRIGLAYWPAMEVATKRGVDPRAFVAAERALVRKAGALWGEILPDGTRSHGGWDWHGHHGLTPWEIPAMWFASGCRDSKKFRTQVQTGIVARKGDNAAFVAAYSRGLKWIQKHGLGRAGIIFSRKAIAALGRLSWYSRWAAVHGLEPGKVIRVRDLNWAAVKVAQKGPRAAITAGYAPTRWGWIKVLQEAGLEVCWSGVMLRHLNPFELPTSTLRQLMSGVEGTAANVVPGVHVALLFGRDLAAARRFVQANGSLHEAGQFTLPGRGFTWSRAGWAALASRFPVQIREWLGVADEIERELGRVPSDLAEIREAATKIPRLAVRGHGILLSEREEEDYKRLWATPPKAFEGIPAPGGAGGIEVGGLRLVQLAHDDPIQPLAGRLVNCCQHLHGAAASCARASWTEGWAAIWAVYEDGHMVAQAFVWRSADGSAIVLDSVEALAARQAIADIFVKAAHAVLGRLGVARVYVGDNRYGVSPLLAPDAPAEKAPDPAFRLLYTDAHRVRLVCEERGGPGGCLPEAMAKAIAEAQRPAAGYGPVNELAEGSGVFCEHCGAEVHPDCEICPSCGANIAEWVDDEAEEAEEADEV